MRLTYLFNWGFFETLLIIVGWENTFLQNNALKISIDAVTAEIVSMFVYVKSTVEFQAKLSQYI